MNEVAIPFESGLTFRPAYRLVRVLREAGVAIPFESGLTFRQVQFGEVAVTDGESQSPLSRVSPSVYHE